jgi:PAS domain S-box-containing protein
VVGPFLRTWKPAVPARLRDHSALIAAAALFAGVLALRLAYDHEAAGTLVLFVVPITICAIARGALGGMCAGAVATGLSYGWALHSDTEIGAGAYLSPPVAFGLVGGIVGRFADQRRVLENRHGRAFDVAVDLQAIAGPDGYFRRVNLAGQALLGYTEAELTARPFVDLVHPDDRARTAAEAESLITAGSTVDFENRYRAADGTYRWLAWRSLAADGVIYASARDITPSKEAHSTLEEAIAVRTGQLQGARFENLRRLALAAEYRDDDTHQHTERVGSMSCLLAYRLGLPTEFVERLRHAAPLHDVGKLGIPDAVLLKPGRLTNGERELMQTHTTIGSTILAGSGFSVLQLGEEIARTHHERWDGRGYPSRLAGEETPIAGRIVAVADVFDALTHARPYKPAWELERAVDEIIAGAGTQFDPAVVEAFKTLYDEGALDRLALQPPAQELARERERATASIAP